MNPSRNLIVAAMVVITALGLGLRFYRLAGQSLWTDEVSSITTAQAPLDRITEISASLNNSLPFYFLLLRPVVGTAKQDLEFRARSLSALAGGLSVPIFIGVVYLWRRHWMAALLAGLLLATNPLHLWYSQEVRGYAVMLFCGALTLLAYELARWQRKPLWWAVYCIAALAATVLHKTGLIFPAACGLWHSWEVLRSRARWRELAVHAATLAVAIAMLTLKSYPPGKEYGRPGSVLEIAYTFMTFLGGYSFGPSLVDIQSFGAVGAVMRHPIQVAILVGVLALAGLAYVSQFRGLIAGKETSLLALGVGIVAAGSLVSAFPYNVRYALPALFGFLALVAAMVIRPGKPWLASPCFGAVLLVGLWADAQWFYGPTYRKGDSRAVAQWLRDNQDRVKSWTVLPDYLGTSIAWYLQSDPAILANSQPPSEAQSTSFPPVPDVLIIGRRHHLREPDKIIAAYRTSAGELQTNKSFAGFELYLRAQKVDERSR